MAPVNVQNEPRHASVLSDDSLQEVVVLARRLKQSVGGELDDSAILAVAEATGAPVDYVRLAVQSIPEERSDTPLDRVRSAFLAFDHDVRRYVMGGILATAIGLLLTLAVIVGDTSGLSGTLAILGMFAAVWNCAVARSLRAAIFAGMIASGLGFLMVTLFTFLIGLLPQVPSSGPAPGFVLLFLPVGAIGGAIAYGIGGWIRKKLGLRDPAKERQELLQQLLEIQDRLKSDERFVTFLSVDIVGSTRAKAESDPLSVEFTFNEYHKYVESVAYKHGGRVHSTAGDGVTVAFEDPKRAYACGKSLLAGLFEFNAYRNKLARPIELRGGLHTGSVLAPGQDIKSVNFAHVIDIAAHMQKVCPIGCLAVSDTTATYIPGGKAVIGDEPIEAQDMKGVVWRPKSKIAPSAVVG
jgi:class 3 adenylate cyclase